MPENQNLKTVSFEFRGDPDLEVFLAGSFNDWDFSGLRLVDSDRSGVYRISMELPCGKHEYKFLINGRWIVDPANPSQVPNVVGSMNSVIEV